MSEKLWAGCKWRRTAKDGHQSRRCEGRRSDVQTKRKLERGTTPLTLHTSAQALSIAECLSVALFRVSPTHAQPSVAANELLDALFP
jgi:hypothetical protein